ncbi:MAG: methyltransferase domain-containing protein [Kiloniellaceae bacterium]
MRYVKPPLDLLRRLIDRQTRSSDIALDVYCARNPLLREFFWARLWMLTLLIRRFSKREGICLDFGGGSGIFMPSLASGFRSVDLIDLNTTQAEQMRDAYDLDNVRITRANIKDFDFGSGAFNAIVAADVLEHFEDLAFPIERIRHWLDANGILYTSLPSENLAYRLLRILFGKQKPHDHYHAAWQVEDFLSKHGFRKIGGIYHPLFLPLFPLFRISAWQKA